MAVTAGAFPKSRTEVLAELDILINSMLASDDGAIEVPFNSTLSESVPAPPFNWSKELSVANEPETAALKVSLPFPPVNAVPVSIPVVSELICASLTFQPINDLAIYLSSSDLSDLPISDLSRMKNIYFSMV
jgi:hypothetical protein